MHRSYRPRALVIAPLTDRNRLWTIPLVLIAALPSIASADEADDDFAARCSSPDVVKCVGFDDESDIAGDWDDNSGILSGASTPTLDPATRASGSSSILFTIPSNSAADTSGSYFTNFSEDLSIQFGENDAFYIQWRQRFSSEYIETDYVGGGGWKQTIIGTGDQPGQLYYSCTDLEVVTVNGYHRGFVTMYNSCSGSASHGPYDGFEEPFADYDFKLQNARPEPYCLYSQGQTDPATYFPPDGNCFPYVADEWTTFQVGIETGPRVGDEFVDSYVRLWVAREGEPAELVIDWGPYNLTAGNPADNQMFGKVWLLPYNTGKDESAAHAEAYTWYDELVISRARIPDPGAPPPPDGTTGGDEGDGGSTGGDGGTGGSADGSGDGGSEAGDGPTSGGSGANDGQEDEGCSCSSHTGARWSVLVFLAVVASARRRRVIR